MNAIKDTEEEKSGKAEGISKISTPIKNILTGDIISKDKLLNSMPFILFLTFLGILYIANGYWAEKTIKDLYRTNKEVKELRSEYITIKSELEIMKQQSQIASIIEDLGLKESTSPPKKIVIKDNN